MEASTGTGAAARAGRAPASAPADPEAPGVDPRFGELRRSGDRRLRNALVEDHRWLAHHCARRFEHKGEPRDDLEQVAMVGLLKAVDRFDPGFGCTFATFALPTVVGELRRHFRDRTWGMRVPRRMKDNYLAVKNVADDLQHELGRSPTVPEMAQRAGLSTEATLEALEVANAYRGVPLATAGADDDAGDDRGDQAPHLGTEERGYAFAEARTVLPDLLAALPGDRERQIVRLRFGENLSQSEIAGRLGVSQVHVSRLLRSSLRLMRRRLAT